MKRIYQVLLPILLLLIVVPRIKAQNEVANYPFSGNANDVSSYHNNASIHGAVLTQDRFGRADQAFQFDGVQNHLEANNAAHLNTPVTTVSFWVKPDELPANGEAYLLSFGGWQERWKISLPSHGKVVWTTNYVGGISDMDAGTGHELVVGEWTHLVMIHDGTKDCIYINGTLAATKAVSGDLNPTTHPLGIGYDPIDKGNFFKGSIDDVIIFDAPMNEAEVAALYFAQSQPPTMVLEEVANYPFSGNFLDATTYGNHAKGSNAEFTTDRFGFGENAVKFNGTDSKVTAANSSQLNSPTTTVMFWVNAAALPATGEGYLLSFGGWQERYKISLPSHGKMVWTTNYEGGISDMDAGGGNELVPGTWTHAAFVHDGTKDMIYINGVLANSKDVVGNLNNTTHPLGIGYDPIDNANFFNGSLDEVQIYDYALSAADIAAAYTEQNTAVIDPDPKVLDMAFCGSFKDGSQFGNNGESYNAEFTADRFGLANNAVYLNDSVGSYVEVQNSKQYNSDYTTVSFWVNVDALPATGEAYLLSFGGWQERWKISLPSHGKVVWTTNYEGGISDMDAGGGHELVPGTWAHVVTSHGPVQDKIYINGVLANSKDVGGVLHHTSHELGIGWNPIDGGNFMDGDIDEVQIYNRDLTDQEVAALYTAQSAVPVFPGDIVAEYPLNANAKDITPYCNDGKVDGAHANKDRFDRANHSLVFNGTTSNVVAANSSQLNSPVTSVSFWVNVNTLPGNGEAYLLSFGGWQERWKISLPSHGKVVWTTNYVGGISDMDAGGGNELVPGEWTHLVFVHDGVKDYIYKNGVLANSKDVVGLLNSTTSPLGIGYNVIDGGSYFDGSLDDIQIYKTALDAAQVLALYDAQKADPGETDVTAPDAPEGLEGTVAFTTVNLTWQPSIDGESGIAGYNVYQDGALIQTVEEPAATISGLAPLTSFEFGVSAVDVAGNESNTSFITLVTGPDESPDTIAPSNPANLVVSPGATSAVFSWDPSTDNTAVAGYVVTLDGNYIDSLDAATTSIFISGLDPSTLYTFEVYAYDFAGNNSEVSDTTVSTTAPIDTGEPGLVAHYKFEGDANDATPYFNHGMIGGNPTFEAVTNRPNASGMCLVFDGQGDSVLVPNAVQLISDYATVSFWIRVDGQNLADAEAYILDFGHWDERWKISLPQHLKIVWTTNGKNVQFDHFISDMDSGDGNELVIGFWWYVTMVHDGVDDIIYVDGQEVNRKPVNTTLNSTARTFGMGNNPVDGGQYFQGALDEVKLYNKALTSAEIAHLYETGTTSVKDLQNEINKYVQIVYPNPTTNELTIKHGFGNQQNLLVRVFDQAGREVGSKRVNASEMNSGQISMNVASLQSGIYSLDFVLGGKNLGSIPFVKQ